MDSDCRIAFFDGELRLTWFNGAAAEAWRLSPAALGDSLESLARDRPWPWCAHAVDAHTARSPRRVHLDGRVIRLEPGADREAVPSGLIVADVDPSSFANADAASVDALWRRLGKMASVVAHEVKNPLAGVSGALHVLAGRFPRGSAERSVVAEMQDRLSGLNATIDELLLFARPVRLRAGVVGSDLLTDRAVAGLAKHPDARQTRVIVEGSAARLHLDVDLVSHALQNLLVNAAQASPPDAVVRVVIASDERTTRFTVLDQGPGVSDELRDAIFEPFFTRKSRGIGLGLTVARRIAEAHDGTLTYETSPERGARFVLALPHSG